MDRRGFLSGVATVAVGTLLLLAPASQMAAAAHVADWMPGKVGAFAHYLPDAKTFADVENFDVPGLVKQLKAMRADYFVITLGQNSGYYCAPNDTLEKLAGYAPHTRCSRRDIPAEIIAALKGTGIRFGLYLPCQPACRDDQMETNLGFPPQVNAGGGDPDRIITDAGSANWAKVIEVWARRYGKDVSLWWFDGAYSWVKFGEQAATRYRAACRAENPDVAIAFNAGVRFKGAEKWSDVWAGEESKQVLETLPESRWATPNLQWQVLSYLGPSWGRPTCRFKDEPWRAWLARVTAKGGAVTLDLNIDLKTGRLDPEQADQFRRVRPAAENGVHAMPPARVRLRGRVGEQLERALNRRVYSDFAHGPVLEECVNAFRTHWDDADGHLGWQGEYWGKTMLCYAGAIRYTHDRRLADWCVRQAHALIDEFQKPNGYLGTCGNEDGLRSEPDNPNPESHWSFNIWGRKYTLWALVELYRATGDRKCLDAAERMADHLVAQLKRLNLTIDRTGSWEGLSSMTILRPLLELHRLRPKREYRALADYIVRATDVAEEPRPPVNVIRDSFTDRPVASWFGKPMFLAKAYEMMSYFEGVADYARLTGSSRSLAATKLFWGHLHREELNPMRSVGYFDHFVGACGRVNGMTELCDVTHWIRLNRELWDLTGETKYLDCIEEAFYNAFLAGVSPDGAWGAHIIRSHGTRHLAAPAQTGMKLHQCCPDNMLRTFFDWADTAVTVARDGSYEVNFYSDADVQLPGATLEIRGGYPVSEDVRLRVMAEKGGTLGLRVPHWAPDVLVDGRPCRSASGRVRIALAPGETNLVLRFPMPPRILHSTATEDVDFVGAEDTAKPEGYTKRFFAWYTPEMKGLERRTAAAQVMRGPLVLAKGRLAGTTREETLGFVTINGEDGWKASLVPAKISADNASVWGAWTLELSRAVSGKRLVRQVPVGDYWSVSSPDDPGNWFSLWF